jgi:hypothetical protein
MYRLARLALATNRKPSPSAVTPPTIIQSCPGAIPATRASRSSITVTGGRAPPPRASSRLVLVQPRRDGGEPRPQLRHRRALAQPPDDLEAAVAALVEHGLAGKEHRREGASTQNSLANSRVIPRKSRGATAATR